MGTSMSHLILAMVLMNSFLKNVTTKAIYKNDRDEESVAKKKTLIPKVVAITAARNTTKVSQRTSVAEWETKLQKDLFLNYQRDVHPSKVNNDGSPEPITVTFDVQVIRIIKLVATQRINDVIPMMIMHQMVHKLSEDIKIQIRFLGSQPEILKKFEEDPTVALKRRMLRDKLIRLTNAEKELTKF